jgi:hypothetical protein
MTRLQAIFEWNMSPEEAKAFRVACIWEELCKKLFPGQRLAKLPDKGDPRKCNLFKHCWKLIRETRGLLDESGLKDYISANLNVLKTYNARVEPNGICGDKAWVRYQVWKRLIEKRAAHVAADTPPRPLVVNPKITKELDCTKRFLFEKFDGEPTYEKTKAVVDGTKMKYWVSSSKVSHYYLLLSPWIKKMGVLEKLAKSIGFDITVYQANLNEDLQEFFNREFKHEQSATNPV